MDVSSDLIRELRTVVGGAHVITDDEVTERYRVDWTRRFAAPHAVVVRPGDVDEVAGIVAACRTAGVAIVAQGGNTGLVGGTVPLDGEVVVSTERFGDVGEVTGGGELTVGAGVTLEAVQDAARRAGWQYGVNIASRASATIGGNVATNAGGLRVVRHGDTRQQLRGVQLVTGTAEVLDAMPGSLRDNTGYHLPSLVAGSEGTLGVITAVRVRLIAPDRSHACAIVGFSSIEAAARAAEGLRRFVPPVAAIEVFLRDGVELVCGVFSWADPLAERAAAYVLIDVESDDAPRDLEDVVGSLGGVVDAAVGVDSTTRDKLWGYRERHTDAIATVGIPHKLDVAVPPGALADFLVTVPDVVAGIEAGARVWLFGHGGEGAIHVNVTGLAPDDDRVDEAVLSHVAALGGSISAEHGIGRAKLPWIGLAHSATELATLARIKIAFDPDRIMNPAVLLPPT